MRESKSRADAGIVTFRHRTYNQRNEEVANCKRIALMLKKTGVVRPNRVMPTCGALLPLTF